MAESEGSHLMAYDYEVHHYFVGGGADHSAEQVRRLVYGHQKGAEGICEPGDLKVLPLAIPGGGVRVVIGSAFIISKAMGAIREMYFGSVTEQQIVEIPPNETEAVRRDLIVMRVRDPFTADSPWADPGAGIEDPEEQAAARAVAQYIFIERIPAVPPGTTRLQQVVGYENDTAFTLARIDLPPMEGTVTDDDDMIVDCRFVHTPRRDIVMRAYNVSSGDGVTDDPVNAQYPSADTWPMTAQESGELAILIPDWATVMKIIETVSDVEAPAGSTGRGRFWVQVGASSNPNRVTTQHSRWSAKSTTVRVSDTKRIPKELRGTVQRFYPRAARERGTVAESIKTSWSSNVDILVEFAQDAD